VKKLKSALKTPREIKENEEAQALLKVIP